MRPTFAKTASSAIAIGSMIAVAGSSAGAAPAASSPPSSGFNDWSCRPSAAHPNPLVLLHGLGGNGPGHYAYLGPYLASVGYCAFAPTYGQATPLIPVGGTISIADSAKEIAVFVAKVRTTTGADKIDIVGHSEGAFHALYGPKFLGYASHVDHVVALAPPTHGTTFAGLVSFGDFLGLRPLVDTVLNTFGCQACDQLIVGGAAVKKLIAGPIAQAGIDYTIIVSGGDALVTPHETSYVREPGVHNVLIQDTCPLDPAGHIGMAYDPTVAQMVTNALDPERAKPVVCGFGPPL
ncbi:esterase/lipase family protein [Pendulispora albinea]|uniref:Lipase n=1 Tax=Pendulispora albinea TaxID=2741071 RepID=A0ABZ2LRI7_9BACT